MKYKFSNFYITPLEWDYFEPLPGYWKINSSMKGFGIYWLWFIVEFEQT